MRRAPAANGNGKESEHLLLPGISVPQAWAAAKPAEENCPPASCDVRRRARGGDERHRAQLWRLRLGGARPEFGFLGWTSIINVTADSICAQLALLPPARVGFQMPIFEYLCKDCSRAFEAIVQGAAKPKCPNCQSVSLEKKLSVFVVAGSS